jgi:hypothetical protein
MINQGSPSMAPATDRCPKELADFALSLDRLLIPAGECLALVDTDLGVACQLIGRWRFDLMEECTAVVTTCRPAMKHMSEVVVPALRSAVSRPERHVTESLLSEVLDWSTRIKTSTQDVRAKYLFVLDQVKYLRQCIDLSSDYLNGAPSEDALHKQHHLESAAFYLASAVRLMEDCSDFWLLLHCAELDFTKIKTETQHALQALLDESNKAPVAVTCWGLLTALGNVCEAEHLAAWNIAADITLQTPDPRYSTSIASRDGFAYAGSGNEKQPIQGSFPELWGTTC